MDKRLLFIGVLLFTCLITGLGIVIWTSPAAEMKAVPEKDFSEFNEGPEKGPDLERWYFGQWHQPFGTVLAPELLHKMRTEAAQLKDESEIQNEPSLTGWQAIGPDRMAVPNSNAYYTGRILDLQILNDGNLLIAAASGGLWKVTGSGASPLSDGLQDLAVSTLAANPGDNNNIFIGTGELYVRGGSGMYVTNNGGASWSSVSDISPTPAGIIKVRFMPGHSDEVHAATTDGYYRSADGGATWTKTLTGIITDFTFTDSNTDGWVFAGIYGQNKIYWSSLWGALWNEIALPLTNVGRVALSYQSGTLYMAIARSDNYNLLGVYKSTDFGSTWTDISPPENYMGNQGWYDNIISAPSPNTIFVGGVDLWKSTDDGNTWSKLSGQNIHADQHAFTRNPSNSDIFIGNDGGLSKSSDFGATWSTSLNRIPITQYVNVDVYDNSLNIIAGGSQDNGISVTTNLGATWTYAAGGDGGGVAFDPDDNNKLYMTNGVYGGDWTFRRLRSMDGGVNWEHINNGIDPSNQWYIRVRNDQVSPIYLFNNSGPNVYFSSDNGDNWSKLNTTPFASDISELTVAKWTSGGGTIVYACMPATTGSKLWLYAYGSWYDDRVPQDLPNDVSIRKVTPHPADYNSAYMIMNGISQNGPSKKIYKTTNLGITWTNITGNLPNIPYSDVVAFPSNDQVLIAGSEFGCYKTTDGGANWFRWDDGMPFGTIITELRYVDDISNTGKFYIVAGSYGRGIYVRELNDGTINDVKEVTAPAGYSLTQNYPNPFNPATSIRFSLPKRDNVELKVYDIQGREVASLVNGTMDAGDHDITFNARNLASGVYIYRIKTSGFTQSKKMTLIK